MQNKMPKINVILLTYNRAHLVERSVDSVLNQTYQDFEIILVNNGSEDNTREVIKKYEGHEKIRVFHLPQNRGFAGGFNFALKHLRAEWFTELGDDDELHSDAFETLLKVLDEVDPTLTAINCNGIEYETGGFSGYCMDKDGYLSAEYIVQKAEGDLWGITKTELVGDKRLNERLPGYESTFWYQINVIAKRYYIHKPLMTYHREHGHTETKRNQKAKTTIENRARLYSELLNEEPYLEILRQYKTKEYCAKCLKGMFFLKIAGNEEAVKQYKMMLHKLNPDLQQRLICSLINFFKPRLLEVAFRGIGRLKSTFFTFAFLIE